MPDFIEQIEEVLNLAGAYGRAQNKWEELGAECAIQRLLLGVYHRGKADATASMGRVQSAGKELTTAQKQRLWEQYQAREVNRLETARALEQHWASEADEADKYRMEEARQYEAREAAKEGRVTSLEPDQASDIRKLLDEVAAAGIAELQAYLADECVGFDGIAEYVRNLRCTLEDIAAVRRLVDSNHSGNGVQQ